MRQELAALADRLRAGEVLEPGEVAGLGLDRDRFGTDGVGLVWDGLALERVAAHVEPDERHHQPFGIVHGGVWCTVVESMGSVGATLRAALDGEVVVGVANSTDLLRAHRRGRVDAVAEPVHVGRTQQLWQVVITRADDGKAVARGQLRLQQMPAERLAGGG